MINLPIDYSEKIENIVKKLDIGFQMIKYSETKKVGDEIFGYFNILKDKIIGGMYVNINKKEEKIKFGEPIMMEDLNLNDRLDLTGLEEKIARELGFSTIKVEVPEEELKKEFIERGYKFKNEKTHTGIKKLKWVRKR